MIFFAHRHAARRENHVRRFRSVLEGALGGLQAVRHAAKVRHLAAQKLQDASHHETVGVVDAAWMKRFAGLHEFIAGKENADAKLPEHRHICSADRGSHTNGSRRQAVAHVKNDAAGRHVGTLTAHPGADLRSLRKGDNITLTTHVLLRHHRIRSRRERCAGKNARTRSRLQRTADFARSNAFCHRQAHWCILRSRSNILEPQCIAVHLRIVPARHINRAGDIFGQHPAGGIHQRNRFRLFNRLGFA